MHVTMYVADKSKENFVSL